MWFKVVIKLIQDQKSMYSCPKIPSKPVQCSAHKHVNIASTLPPSLLTALSTLHFVSFGHFECKYGDNPLVEPLRIDQLRIFKRDSLRCSSKSAASWNILNWKWNIKYQSFCIMEEPWFVERTFSFILDSLSALSRHCGQKIFCKMANPWTANCRF